MPRFRRYHYEVHFPKNLGEMVLEFYQSLPKVDVTTHAAEQLLEDKRGVIPLPTKAELFDASNTLVEIYEILDREGNPTGKLQKAVIRIKGLSEKLDYTYVVAREGFVVSTWSNSKTDKHRLTGKNEYYKPE